MSLDNPKNGNYTMIIGELVAMKKTIYKIASVITAVLAIIAVIGAVTVTGSGFLDLSNIARYFLIGFAVVFGIAAVMTGRYGWKSR